jgi:hypothetical protein
MNTSANRTRNNAKSNKPDGINFNDASTGFILSAFPYLGGSERNCVKQIVVKDKHLKGNAQNYFYLNFSRTACAQSLTARLLR